MIPVYCTRTSITHPHNATCDTTHTTTISATLAWLLSLLLLLGSSQRDISSSMSVSSTYVTAPDGRNVRYRWWHFANCCAGCSFGKLSKKPSVLLASRTRWWRTPRVWSSHAAGEARHQHVCVVGRNCWRMKTSLTPQALRRSSLEPTSVYPTLFSRCYCSGQAHSFTSIVSWSPEKTPKLDIRSDGRYG